MHGKRVLAQAATNLEDGNNRFLFALRQFMRWQRGGYKEKAEDKTGLFRDRAHALLADTLLTHYGLGDLRLRATRSRYAENMALLPQLEALAGKAIRPEHTRWLDAGAKNWSVVDALYAFAQAHGSGPELHGIELDGYRRYADWHLRCEYGRTYAAALPGAVYRVGDLMDEAGPYDVITHILPFVFEEPLRAWGLPVRYFAPEALLRHLAGILSPGGVMLIINQGEAEYAAQQRLFKKSGVTATLEITPVGALPDRFGFYTHTRYGTRCLQKIPKTLSS